METVETNKEAKKPEIKFEAPKVGEPVNYVAPHSLLISKAKVTAVSEEHDGRLITVEVPIKKINKDGDEVVTNQKVTAVYRPKIKLAGGTWHLALLTLLAAAVMSLQQLANAGIPNYHTYSAAGNAAAPATVIFPADPNAQVRLVSLFYRVDTNTAVIAFSSGTTAYSLAATNTATSAVTNVIDATNGLLIGSIAMLQHAGLDYSSAITSYGNSGTNNWTNSAGYVLTNSTTTLGAYGQGPVGFPSTNVSWVAVSSGGFGVLPLIGDEIYLMGSVTSFPGGTTNTILNISGDDIYSGNYGRPVQVQLTPALATNNIYSASAHYDSASQP
jgi:hypothetical protein